MKTLADLKRRLVQDARITLVTVTHNAVAIPHRLLDRPGIISQVQTNGFWVRRPGITADSWAEMPKAANLSFVDDKTYIVKSIGLGDRRIEMTYQIEPPVEGA